MHSYMPAVGMTPRKVKVYFQDGETLELRGVQRCDFEIQTNIDEFVVTETKIQATIVSFTDHTGEECNVTKAGEQVRFLRMLSKGVRNGKKEDD